jgi:hypothetical protein
MTITDSVRELNSLIEQKRILEAFDRFYADDVVMEEGGGTAPRVGGKTNRLNEERFVAGLKAFDARLIASAVDERNGTALNEWSLKFEHAEWGAADLRQVAVQTWRDNRIVHEAFYKL